jgi:hypothetical protein
MSRPDRTRILIKPGSIREIHDPFSFSAPPLTGPRRHAIVMYALIHRLAHPQHSRSALLRCAVLACWFDNGFPRMLVRGPVHGMQGVLENRVKSKRSLMDIDTIMRPMITTGLPRSLRPLAMTAEYD